MRGPGRSAAGSERVAAALWRPVPTPQQPIQRPFGVSTMYPFGFSPQASCFSLVSTSSIKQETSLQVPTRASQPLSIVLPLNALNVFLAIVSHSEL